MYNFTVPMALMDYLPVFFFGVTAVLLLRDLYNKMFKGAYALLAAGCVNVFLAGFCKATWKLLYAANICDFVALEEMFMPVNSLGLLFVGLSLIGMLVWKRKGALLSVAPPVFASSMPFIMMMVVGLGGLCVGLSVLAAKMKKSAVMILFILSFVCAMAMGYMSSQDSTQSWVNWVEQSINTVSQLCLMLGVIALHKAGLKGWTWEGEAV
ncbi:MAG: hypothetical protein IKA47_09060 [Oscillospiraceae bacterium]|nr:hypothetical protein [Oscillospiraceae bacterium]